MATDGARCPGCGAPLAAAARFCPECGRRAAPGAAPASGTAATGVSAAGNRAWRWYRGRSTRTQWLLGGAAAFLLLILLAGLTGDSETEDRSSQARGVADVPSTLTLAQTSIAAPALALASTQAPAPPSPSTPAAPPATPTAAPTPAPTPAPPAPPTPQAVAGPTFVVNTAPVGCHREPATAATIAGQRQIGTVQAMDLLIRQPDGTWHREVSERCWTRTDPGPVRTFTASDQAETFARTVRPTPTPPPPTPVRTATPAPAPLVSTPAATPARAANCHPSYPTLCLPFPPDLDCGQIAAVNFPVLPPDPHRLDADNDGIGCERR